MQVAVVIARTFAGSREFFRRAAATPPLALRLMRGDATIEEALPALDGAGRVWFEGAGPLLDALLARPTAAWLPGAVLRLGADEARHLPGPDFWRLVGDLVVPTPGAAAHVRRTAPPPAGRARIHVVPDDDGPGALDALTEILVAPPRGLTVPTWQRIARLGELCTGDVFLLGDPPDEVAAFLDTSCGCAVAHDASALGEGQADAVVLWPAPALAEAYDGAVSVLKPGGTLAAVLSRGSGPSPEEVASRVSAATGRPAEIDGGVVVAPGAGERDPRSHVRVESPPLVTVGIFVYNRERDVGPCIESHRRQTYAPLEIVVVDDGSTDGTGEAVWPHLEDPRVRLVAMEHAGRPAARNRVLAEARGAWIAWIGSDDRSLPGRIAAQVEAVARDPSATIVHGDWLQTDEAGRVVEVRRGRTAGLEGPAASMLRGCAIIDATALVRRDLYDRLGPYDAAFPRGQDYEFFVRAALVGDLRDVYLPLPLITGHQTSTGRPDLVPVHLEIFARLTEQILEAVPLEGLVDARGRDLGEDPRLNVGRLLAAKAIQRDAPPDHPLLARADTLLAEAEVNARPADRAAAAALRSRLARHRERALVPTA